MRGSSWLDGGRASLHPNPVTRRSGRPKGRPPHVRRRSLRGAACIRGYNECVSPITNMYDAGSDVSGTARVPTEWSRVMTEPESIRRFWSLELNRRALLRGGALGGVGLAAAALIGCGGDDDDDDTTSTAPASGATSGSSTTATTSTSTDTSNGDDDSADSTKPSGDSEDASEQVEALGEWIKDPDLPYPFNYPEPNKVPKPGGVMKVATSWDYQTIDPVTSAAGGTVTVPNVTYNRLLGIVRGPAADPYKLELEPELAQSWERSPDGLTFTFNITPGITWQNVPPLSGRAFTADDAKFAIERYANEGVHQAYYNNAATYEAADDLTFKIGMANPTADFLNPLGSNKQTIFPRELVDDGTIETRAIGTGGFILTDAAPAQHVIFEKNPDYWEREVLMDGFEFRIILDGAARTAAFRVGQIDYAYSLAPNLATLEKILETNPDVQVNLLVVTYNGTTFGMNLTLPKYADERVRRAISLAFDRELMVDLVYDGLAKIFHVIPWTYLYDEEPTLESGGLGNWIRHDPAEARKLLAAAGAEGLTMVNMYYPYSGLQDQTAEIAQANLKDAGITMTGGAVDYTEFNSAWVPAKLPDVSTVAWSTSGFDADNWFHGQIHSESPGNRWRINDPQLDAWAEEQQLELDPDARRDIWQKIYDRDLDMMYRPGLPQRELPGGAPAVGARYPLGRQLAERQQLLLRLGRRHPGGLAGQVGSETRHAPLDAGVRVAFGPPAPRPDRGEARDPRPAGMAYSCCRAMYSAPHNGTVYRAGST
ncbi:MAG: ABC transporter substrate-binding protein [Chloroflexi bacterium]|nr:ABC transporter substrate-binding protein [Chloroflexota bacterium]